MARGNHVAYGIGIFLILTGIIIGFAWPFIFEYIRKQRLELSPSSETYKLWIKTPLPIYLEIYLFNWTNAQDFLEDKKTKPQFEEVGPFVFKEAHERVNLTWNENNTVSYNQRRMWSFVPEESVNLSTPVVNLNVIATTITRMASKYQVKMKALLDFLYYVYKEKLLISRSASQWLFEGMEDKLLDFIRTLMGIPYDRFGWFYGRNLSSSYDGTFNIQTGEDSIYELGETKEWNYVNKTKFYEGECGVVNGSSGDLFAPIKGSKDHLNIFISDFCGPLSLKYAGPKSVGGLRGHHFVGDDAVFDSGTGNPSANCFCSGECSPKGVRNVTTCRQAPLFISFPHFYLADPSFVQAVGGMTPNKTEHEFSLSIDPGTGMPLEVRAQLQLNLLLEPVPWCPMFSDVPKIYVPMMWFRQRVKVSPDLVGRSKQLEYLGKAGSGLACALALTGVLVIVVKVCLSSRRSRRKESRVLIHEGEGEEEEEENDSDRNADGFCCPQRLHR